MRWLFSNLGLVIGLVLVGLLSYQELSPAGRACRAAGGRYYLLSEHHCVSVRVDIHEIR